MIYAAAEKEILRKQKKGEFVLPFYDKFCLSNIPALILDLFRIKSSGSFLRFLPRDCQDLGENKNLKVVLLLLDGFGYYQWLEAYRRLPFFRKVTERGVLLPLTTVFPSTTAAAITTLQTGLLPKDHALFEWFLYIRELDEVIMTLPFSSIKERIQDSLWRTGINPKILLQAKTIYERLKKEKIPSYFFQHASIAKSAYTGRAFSGSQGVVYKTYADFAISLRKKLSGERRRAYFHAYWGNIDTIAHKYGPRSEECRAEISILSTLLEHEFLQKLDRRTAENTVLIVTADHGQIPVDPAKTVYLNKYKKLVRSFERSSRAKPILPCGSPRDVFLHIAPRRLQEMQLYLARILKRKARIFTMEEALRRELFGQGPLGKKFLERAGNLLVLARKNNTIWYEFVKGKKFDHHGHHGGLSKQEMLIPFAMARLSDLI